VLVAWLALRAAPLVRVGTGWFVIALLPVLGLVPVFADLADRFTLLPTVGLAWLTPLAMTALARRWRPLGVLVPALVLVVYGAGAVVEGAAWSDELALWRKAVALQPRSAQAQRNLGLILLQRGLPDEALVHLEEARTLGEQAGELDRRRAMALEALGRWEEAEAAAAQAVRRAPALGPAHALRGGLLLRLRGVGPAEEELALARRYDPEGVSTLLLEAQVAARAGDGPRELAATGRLVARFPREPRFWYQRGEAQLRGGDAPGAAASAEACLRLSPGQVQCLCLGSRAAGERATAEQRRACGEVGGGR
jgi:tetratricopeptide (TPR) repeat protein